MGRVCERFGGFISSFSTLSLSYLTGLDYHSITYGNSTQHSALNTEIHLSKGVCSTGCAGYNIASPGWLTFPTRSCCCSSITTGRGRSKGAVSGRVDTRLGPCRYWRCYGSHDGGRHDNHVIKSLLTDIVGVKVGYVYCIHRSHAVRHLGAVVSITPVGPRCQEV